MWKIIKLAKKLKTQGEPESNTLRKLNLNLRHRFLIYEHLIPIKFDHKRM